MKFDLKSYKRLQNWAEKMGGVFTLSDLQVAFNTNNGVKLSRLVKKYQSEGLCKRFIRGYYLWQNPDKKNLAQKIYPESYLSLTTALAHYLMIGTTPEKTVYSIKTGPAKKFSSDEFTLVYKGIADDLFFGFETSDGINIASPEKALLDTLYFYVKGAKFSFDIYSDIQVNKLKKKRIRKYLEKYSNPKFIKFVNNYLNERL